MSGTQQMDLIGTFETSKSPNAIFCHEEFLEKLAAQANSAVGRRAVFLMQRLAVDLRRLHYKPTFGPNRGWRRSRLGGNHGSHFYAWWAPKNAPPLKESQGFTEAPEHALFLRDIRHHDDHSPLSPQSFADHYLPVTVREIRSEEYGPAPWTQPQARFASGRQPVRILKGHPGSGKTTALWHAADSTEAERTLYITYSRDLGALARDYFDRYCSSHKRFEVITFPNLIRQLLGSSAPVELERDMRQRFRRNLAPFARTLGPWINNQDALYDEFYAHLVGDALPVAIGRFAASKQPRVPDNSYRPRRARFLGPQAVNVVLETAARLEREGTGTLADRYFPELGLAWHAAERLRDTGSGRVQVDPAWLEFNCIAVDEVQDLTPIEAVVLIELASLIYRRHRIPVSLLLAGDEAQTVRPTDFEWAWLSDLLHHKIGTASEYKLSANLRSPRRIAELVNRAWDLYSLIEKQERPRGIGNAEIDDDATDQVLYCTAVPGPELDALLTSLAAREGLALITLEETVPEFVPEPVRPAVLTVSEAKGLDFHSVCVIDPGRHVGHVMRQEAPLRTDSSIESLGKRLAIDQLRVSISRPSERLLWLDINPSDSVVRASMAFLNGDNLQGAISPSVPAAVMKTLEEEELDTEERVQRCQADARQYLEVKPDMAWSRAQQAVTLLGRPGAPAAEKDQTVRDAAYLTLAEICFTLAMRRARLAPELGKPDLFEEAERAAMHAQRFGLASVIHAIKRVDHALPANRLPMLAELAYVLPQHQGELESWLRLEIGVESRKWIETLEAAALVNGRNAATLVKLLPPFYEALSVSDRAARTERLQRSAIQMLIRVNYFKDALDVLSALPQREPKLEAACHEGLADLRTAAECFRAAGDSKSALRCYRAIPDLEAALNLLREMGEHPAGPSLEWVSKLRALVAERPDKFTKMVTPAEKKLLEELLEEALGVKRRKRAVAGPSRRKGTEARNRPART
jgi:hypothetical protein